MVTDESRLGCRMAILKEYGTVAWEAAIILEVCTPTNARRPTRNMAREQKGGRYLSWYCATLELSRSYVAVTKTSHKVSTYIGTVCTWVETRLVHDT